MQHNARDPNRDHNHGRIYRITYPGRPLVKPAQVAGASLDTLLNNLKEPESRTRYRSRREIRAQFPSLDRAPRREKMGRRADRRPRETRSPLGHLGSMNAVDESLLRELLASPDFHARAAAVRVLRYNTHRIADHAALHGKSRRRSGRPRAPRSRRGRLLAARCARREKNRRRRCQLSPSTFGAKTS